MESGVSTPQNHAISKTYLRCQTTAVTHTHTHTRTHTRNSYLSVYTFNCLSVYLSVGLWDCGSVCQPDCLPACTASFASRNLNVLQANQHQQPHQIQDSRNSCQSSVSLASRAPWLGAARRQLPSPFIPFLPIHSQKL